MTLETFFEKFHLFADAPNAVAKMRELVQPKQKLQSVAKAKPPAIAQPMIGPIRAIKCALSRTAAHARLTPVFHSSAPILADA